MIRNLEEDFAAAMLRIERQDDIIAGLVKALEPFANIDKSCFLAARAALEKARQP